jgi:hypothetical protein
MTNYDMWREDLENDLKKLRNVVFEYRNIKLTDFGAEMFWHDHSVYYSATWLKLPDDSENLIKAFDKWYERRVKDLELYFED